MALSQIKTTGIADDAITAALIAADAVGSSEIAAGAVVASEIGANSVDSSELVDGAVDLSHMSVNSIDSDQYVDGSIDTVHLANDAVTGAKIALFDDALAATTTHFLIADGTDYSSFALSGDVTCTNGGVVTIANTAVQQAMVHTDVFTGQSAITEVADADVILVYDDSASAFKKVTKSNFGGGIKWSEKTSSFTAVKMEGYLINTGSAVTATLPASPAIGQEVRLIDATGQAATNNITVARNSEKIQGAAENLTISTNRAAICLVYYNSTHGWVLREN